MARVAGRAGARPRGDRVAVSGLVAVRTLLGRLRAEWSLAATVAGVALVTAFVFAAAPRLLNAVSRDGLRYAVTNAAVYQRNLVMAQGERLPASAGSDPLAAVDAAGASLQASLPTALRSVIARRTYVVDAVRYTFPQASSGGAPTRHVTFRYQSGVTSHIKLVAGRMPAPTTATVMPTTAPRTPVPIIEVAMSQATAQTLGLTLNQPVVLEPDFQDNLIGRGNVPNQVAVDVVGYIQILDPNADYWYADSSLQTPSVYDDGNTTEIYGTGLFAPQAYADVLKDTNPAMVEYSWRFYVAPSRFTAEGFGPLQNDVKRLDATYGSAFTTGPTDLTATTGLGDIFSQYAGQRRLTESILSLAVIGLLAVALAVIGLVGAFVAERRREAYALVRGRGGSTAQVLGAQAAEAALLGIPAVLLGYLAALLAVHAEPTIWSPGLALGIALATVVLTVGATLPYARRGLQALERDEVRRDRFSPRRAAFEVFVVALAAAGIYLLRRRGLAGDSATAQAGGFDPYLAAVPILLGLAVGLVTLRLYVLPIRLLAWWAATRRDLVLFLGLRRVSRQSLVTSVPLLVLLLAVAISVFSSVMLHTIDVGQVETSWQLVGAPFRVDAYAGATLDPTLDLSKVPGVTATASALNETAVIAASGSLPGGLVTLFAVQTSAYEKVTAGSPVDPHFSGALLAAPTGPGVGTGSLPIPAIVSSESPLGRPMTVGETFGINLHNQTVTFVVDQVRDSFPALSSVSGPFVVTSLDALHAALPGYATERTNLYVRAPDTAGPALNRAMNAQYAAAILTSRAAEYASVHDSPLIAGAVSGFQIGVAVAALYSVLAVVVALALTGRARARDVAYLRTLGLSPRQVLGLIAAEQAPPVVVALVVGTALGVGIIRLIAPALDFTAFTGPNVPVVVVIDWPTVVLLGVGLVVVVAVAVAATSALTERTSLSGVLRMGDR
ncbi:MAG TPA: FtsX-like permease family protein [Thermomicrobiaceae bacterium]|nr:FtsX-like permease family protein [Thermomicrobiaceae bacterium]